MTHRARTKAPAAGPMSVPVARASRAPGAKKSSLSKSTTRPASPCSPLRASCGGGLAQLNGMPPHERLKHLSHGMHPPGKSPQLVHCCYPKGTLLVPRVVSQSIGANRDAILQGMSIEKLDSLPCPLSSLSGGSKLGSGLKSLSKVAVSI